MEHLGIKENIINIVNDFDTFCKYIDNNRIKLTKQRKEIGRNDAFEINKNLYFKENVTKPNYPQKSYVFTNFMFQLCKESKLYKHEGDSKGNVYLIRTNRMDDVDKLNEFEKYVFLLETYWTDYNFKNVGYFGSSALSVSRLVQLISKKKMGEVITYDDVQGKRDLGGIFDDKSDIVYHLSLFGLCDYEKYKQIGRRTLQKIEYVKTNEFSIEMCKLLDSKRKIEDWNKELLETGFTGGEIRVGSSGLYDAIMDFGIFKEIDEKELAAKMYKTYKKWEPFSSYAFKEIFGDKLQTFTVEQYKKDKVEGSYVFKVTTAGAWRKIKISYKSTLEDLHDQILTTFEFSGEHLFAFYMNGDTYSDDCYNDSRMDCGPYAKDVEIGELDLYMWQSFLYFYDFGASWRFQVQLVDVIEHEEILEYAILIESEGDAPEQYVIEDWDWE